ncbi:MAG: tight adherence protein [Frankiaceae bacterium]|nr:tight adherence protein [Frankiaceae bacterium]
MSGVMVGAGIGAIGAGGAVLAFVGSPPRRKLGLDDRLAPYLRDTALPSRLLMRGDAAGGGSRHERLFRDAMRDLATRIDKVLGGTAAVRRRLDRLGNPITVQEFRTQQATWALGGLLAAVAVMTLLSANAHKVLAVQGLGLIVLGSLAGLLGRDRYLSQQVKARETRMLSEFPTIAELIALAVSAGESPLGALERIVRLTRGELSAELARTLADTRAGASIMTALESLGARTGLQPLARFADGVAVAVERGTPLADVLRAQAIDAREAGKRALLESGGRKEIGMMVPVVFFVLPVTILFMIFPGAYSLTVSVP